MVTAKEGRSLHAKLAEVMAEAERIPKNGTYTGQGGFKYVLVGDAADAIRTQLASRKVSMLPSAVDVISEREHETRSGGTMTTLTVRTTWTLVDGETGETAIIQSIGTGADAGDKASPKAQTNAMKYALLMGFLLSTGDDPEQSDSSDRQATEAVQSRGETLELLGRIQKAGKVEKGGASGYQAEWRETPEGHSIGFRLNIDGEDRNIPQVLVTGGIGEALYLGHPAILGERVTVKGHLYNVRVPGRKGYYRLVVGEHPDSEFIETPQIRVPAEALVPDVSPLREPEEPEPIPVAEGQEPLFDPEKLDPEERLLVGGA
jgi:hypothetical protein